MDVRIVSSKDELKNDYSTIATLFSRAYGRALSQALWNEYYLENPYGPPLVTMLFEESEMVGHYGLIPQVLVGTNGSETPYYLASTLMIAPEYQNTQVFVLLVNQLLEIARKSQRHFMLAFPNQRSFLPLNKLFHWKCLLQTSFYRLSTDDANYYGQPEVRNLKRLDARQELSTPCDETYWRWRGRCHNYRLCQVEESLQLIYKELDKETIDLMDLVIKDPKKASLDLLRFAAHAGFSQIVLTGYHAEQLALDPKVLERWSDHILRMCYCSLSRQEIPTFSFNLMLTDVF